MTASMLLVTSRMSLLCLVVMGMTVTRRAWLSGSYPLPAKTGPRIAASNQVDMADSVRGDMFEIASVTAPMPPVVKSTMTAPSVATSLPCRTIPGADRVMVLLKTGATELYQKLPTHLMTTFQCIPHFKVFSDLRHTFAQVPVFDAIAPISKKVREQHPDFQLYRQLEKWQREGQDMSKLVGKTGWDLDKWKFLPMLHDAYASAGPEIDWFVIMEADTSISWSNLLLWLRTMDPHHPYYLGSQNIIGGTMFAHGGSGIVISRIAASRLEDVRLRIGEEAYDQAWEDTTSVSCCGDEVLARAFWAADVPMTPAWPLMQGETMNSIDWTKDHWCAPPISWHHVSPLEVDAYWRFQLNWAEEHGWEWPYLFRDVFEHFIERHISVNRTFWNNLSKDRRLVAASLATAEDDSFHDLQDHEKEAVGSESACAEACVQAGAASCIQWMFTPGRCYLGKDLRFGVSDETSSEHWTSGWIQGRVQLFKKSMLGCTIRWQG